MLLKKDLLTLDKAMALFGQTYGIHSIVNVRMIAFFLLHFDALGTHVLVSWPYIV